MTQSASSFRVAIVGGGIAGLALALMFEKLDIEYVLLEAHDALESKEGAGIGLQPNGLRILDQLGLLDEIEEATTPLSTWFSYDGEGELLSSSSAMGQYTARIGYGVMFVERCKLLRIMSSHIKRKECVHTSSSVVSIKDQGDSVLVRTQDGLAIEADMVVGADGVRSRVRDFIDFSTPGKQVQSADDYMKVKYATVYGMSSPTPGINTTERFAVYREGVNIIGFTGLDGIVYWFVFESLDETFPLSKCPRYSAKDADELCRSVIQIQCTPSLKFEQLYENRTVALKIAVEEGVAETWHVDRAVIIGDAACKMTPSGGQGANQCIESAAVLVNELMSRLKSSTTGGKLSPEALQSAFEAYSEQRQKASEVALGRSRMIADALFHPESPIVKQMTSLPDEAWLRRALMGLAGAAVLEDVPLTARGHLYNKAIQELKEQIESEQKGTSNTKPSQETKGSKEGRLVHGMEGLEKTNGKNEMKESKEGDQMGAMNGRQVWVKA